MTNSDHNHKSSVPIITYTILGLVILVALGIPALQSKFIYPRFINLIIEKTENDAIRIGRIMMRMVLQDCLDETCIITEKTKAFLDQTTEDYVLRKVKVFAASGETIYSTIEKDVGKVNNYPYFNEIVAKGKVYTKVVQKDTKSLEDQVFTDDVVEIYIPILEKGKFVGAFELYYNISDHKESMDAIIARTNLLLQGLAGIIVIVVLGAAVGLRRGMKDRKIFEDMLYTLATRDRLTGLYNRGRFLEMLQWTVEKHLRYQENTSILMFDIDRFKNVNDTYGHQAGDEVLVSVARTCEQVMRKSDMVARYGGEEFVVLLPETEQTGAVKIAEKLRQAVAELLTSCFKGQIGVTISIGVVDFSEVRELSFETVIKRADDRLYKAKKMGRNRVCMND